MAQEKFAAKKGQNATTTDAKQTNKLVEEKKIIEKKQEKEQKKDIFKKTLTAQRVEQGIKAIADKQAQSVKKPEAKVEEKKSAPVVQPTAASSNITSLVKTSKPIPKELPVQKVIK